MFKIDLGKFPGSVTYTSKRRKREELVGPVAKCVVGRQLCSVLASND